MSKYTLAISVQTKSILAAQFNCRQSNNFTHILVRLFQQKLIPISNSIDELFYFIKEFKWNHYLVDKLSYMEYGINHSIKNSFFQS